MVHNITDNLGDIIKAARQKADITVEALAEKVEKTERYIYRIENEGKKTELRCSVEVNPCAEHRTELDLLPREAVQRFRGRRPCSYALQLR